jgi:hypothetical protein
MHSRLSLGRARRLTDTSELLGAKEHHLVPGGSGIPAASSNTCDGKLNSPMKVLLSRLVGCGGEKRVETADGLHPFLNAPRRHDKRHQLLRRRSRVEPDYGGASKASRVRQRVPCAWAHPDQLARVCVGAAAPRPARGRGPAAAPLLTSPPPPCAAGRQPARGVVGAHCARRRPGR